MQNIRSNDEYAHNHNHRLDLSDKDDKNYPNSTPPNKGICNHSTSMSVQLATFSDVRNTTPLNGDIQSHTTMSSLELRISEPEATNMTLSSNKEPSASNVIEKAMHFMIQSQQWIPKIHFMSYEWAMDENNAPIISNSEVTTVDIVSFLQRKYCFLDTVMRHLNYPNNSVFKFSGFRGEHNSQELILTIIKNAKENGTALIVNVNRKGRSK